MDTQNKEAAFMAPNVAETRQSIQSLRGVRVGVAKTTPPAVLTRERLCKEGGGSVMVRKHPPSVPVAVREEGVVVVGGHAEISHSATTARFRSDCSTQVYQVLMFGAGPPKIMHQKRPPEICSSVNIFFPARKLR